jgi:hypothetical protein
MVAVEVVGDIGVNTGPGLEGLELALGLWHVAVEVVEVAKLLCLEAGISIGGVEALVVLDVDKDIILGGCLEQEEVMLKCLDGGLGDQDVDLALDGV